MNEIIPTTAPSTPTLPAGGDSIDLLTSVEILLVKDYNSQLVGLRNQMKSAAAVKKAYRKDMEKLGTMLIRQSKEVNKDGKTTCITVNKEEKAFLDTDQDYFPDPTTLEAKAYPPKSNPIDIKGRTTKKVTENVQSRDPRTGRTIIKQVIKEVPDGYYIPKDAIEKKSEMIKTKLDAYNEQSDLMSTELQAIMGQRKNALETVSNLTSKYADTMGTIVRNIKG